MHQRTISARVLFFGTFLLLLESSGLWVCGKCFGLVANLTRGIGCRLVAVYGGTMLGPLVNRLDCFMLRPLDHPGPGCRRPNRCTLVSTCCALLCIQSQVPSYVAPTPRPQLPSSLYLRCSAPLGASHTWRCHPWPFVGSTGPLQPNGGPSPTPASSPCPSLQ